MPKPYLQEFRDDVVAVARKGQAPLHKIANDFGISEGCLHNWMKKADVADGNSPGLDDEERKQLRAANLPENGLPAHHLKRCRPLRHCRLNHRDPYPESGRRRRTKTRPCRPTRVRRPTVTDVGRLPATSDGK